MLSTQLIADPATDHVAVFVDLIGDLDATLGSTLADTLATLAANGNNDIFLTTRHVAATSDDGLAALDSALTSARARGCRIAIDPGNRRMRAAFTVARIGYRDDRSAAFPSAGRHLMIARHAAPPKARRRSA
jgi:anti-anti-sigma regulatory factor